MMIKRRSVMLLKSVLLPQNSTDTVNAEANSAHSKNQSHDVGKLSPSSLSTNEVIQDAETGQKSAEIVNKVSKPRGIFNKIMSWCKLWRSDYSSNNVDGEFNKGYGQISNHSDMKEIFTESLWNDMFVFLESSQGSASILGSKSRLEMMQNLQRFGPSRLQSLSESHILHLVDLLISEKKWVIEIPSQTFPFRLGGPSGSSPLSKPIKSKESTKQSKEIMESDGNSQGLELQVGGSELPIKKKPSPQNSSQMLSDCQKLVNEIIKEYPDGFDISKFKKLFLDKYGYYLKAEQLGCQKLAALLQTMPTVKLEANYILTSRDHSKCSHSENAGPSIEEYSKTDLSGTKDDSDTQSEELGPIAQMNTKKDRNKVNHNFETVSDSDLSDTENERCQTLEDSPLLRILDSWYSSNSRITSDGSDAYTDHSSDNKKPSSKRYSFVADKPMEEKQGLINDTLGNLKKSKIES